MKLYAGTSGFSYKEWRGNFYPEDLPAGEMLHYFSRQLPAVEINNTFYRLPKEEVIESWAGQVPAAFRFTLKASQKITHYKRLKGAEEETAYLLRAARVLGQRLGAILFQLPPNLKEDLPRLRDFLAGLPAGARAAFEFRHSSWQTDEVRDALSAHGCALCIADMDDEAEPAMIATTDWGYLRLRRQAYDEAALRRWAERVTAQAWNETFAFFKHEDAGVGPRLARRFLDLVPGGEA